jgi:hypothetical protein
VYNLRARDGGDAEREEMSGRLRMRRRVRRTRLVWWVRRWHSRLPPMCSHARPSWRRIEIRMSDTKTQSTLRDGYRTIGYMMRRWSQLCISWHMCERRGKRVNVGRDDGEGVSVQHGKDVSAHKSWVGVYNLPTPSARLPPYSHNRRKCYSRQRRPRRLGYLSHHNHPDHHALLSRE